MDDLRQRIANLSPEKRALLELRLMQRGADRASLEAIPRRRTAGPCPLSFAQQRLWFLAQLEPESSHYNEPKAVRMRGDLNVTALQCTLNALVARHEVLRTTFIAEDGQPTQVIPENRSVELPLIDLRAWPNPGQETEAQRLLLEAIQRPFDLSRDLMLRTLLLQLDAAEHILLLVTHHIASDGWSTGILWRDLSALYAEFAAGRASPLPELPIQYADYALWQRQWLQGEVLDAQLAYWKRQLTGVPAVLELPTDRPRRPVQTYQGARQSVMLPQRLTEALKALSRREGVTLFMTLLAAFQILLHRYTGQEDIVVGSPIAGRTRKETEEAIGFFVNTLVLRTDLSGYPTFRELLGRVREVALGAYAHQDLPFEKLVEELQPERTLSHAPLFQVMFALQNVPRTTLDLAGLTLEPLEVERETAKFDLSLAMIEEGTGLRGRLSYNTDLFDAATVGRLLGHFQTLLGGIAAAPDMPISQLPLLTAAERQQLLVAWNDPRTDYPLDACMHELFEAQVERSPEAVAVVYEDQHLTYRELNARANQLAHHLQKLGVGPEVRVGICVERSPEMLVGLLGILKAAGAFVPLDASYPQERLAFMLEDSRAPVLVTQQRLLPRLPVLTAHVVCLDTDWTVIGQESQANAVREVRAQNLAYVIYTSGTTGQPKGVMVEHKSLTNYLCWVNERLLSDRIQNLPVITRLTFDASLKQLFAPLLRGRAVWVLPDDVVMQPAVLLQALDRRQHVGLNCVPSFWQAMLDAIDADPTNLSPANLTHLLLGGEPLSKELVDRSLDAFPQLKMWNLFGPTETTATSAATPIASGDNVTIGRPIANTQAYILDRHLNPVPIGVPGELYLGGVGVARGYLNRPELTAEKFVSDPFSQEPGARLYKTGDLARYRPDGSIAFLGRRDDQVKIRGIRIELGEIEAVLGQHPAVRQAAVLAWEDHPGSRYLVAYVVPIPGASPSSADLRRFLQEKLPEYMVPSTFVFLDALPLTPNGKVDRRGLPAPERVRPMLEDTFVPPRNLVEEAVAKIWAELLRLERVGIDDNFFELGGHSLLATQLMSRVRATFYVELPLRSLFQQPTVAAQAEMVVKHEAVPGQSAAIARVLAKMETMSADEIRAMLQQKQRDKG